MKKKENKNKEDYIGGPFFTSSLPTSCSPSSPPRHCNDAVTQDMALEELISTMSQPENKADNTLNASLLALNMISFEISHSDRAGEQLH